MSALPPSSDDTRIWDIWESIFRLPVKTIYATPTDDTLSDAPLSTHELATLLSLDARALAILLVGLCSQGLIDKRLDRWSATHEARRWLHPQAKAYWGAFFSGFPGGIPMHAPLLEAIRSGKRPQDRQRSPHKPRQSPQMAANVPPAGSPTIPTPTENRL